MSTLVHLSPDLEKVATLSREADPEKESPDTPHDSATNSPRKGSLDDGYLLPFDQLSPAEKKAERRFIWKLDLIFVLVGFLGYTFKYLDQVNIQNAYVSGMKEELNVQGNQYNYFTTLFNVGYIIIIYPSCIAVSHLGPHYWLPSAEVIWGILTCCLSVVTTPQQVLGLRFLIGLAEGTCFPGYATVMSSWYMPNEVALRIGLFNVAQPIGSMFAGIMQGAISETMHNHGGRSGWRWGFIINGVCTIFVALLAYFSIPGYPERPNRLAKWYLTDEDFAIARRRNARISRKPQVGITVKSFFRAFTFWQLWLIAFVWAFGYNTLPSTMYQLWLKSLKNPDGSLTYTIAQLNYLPVIGFALQTLSTVVLCGLSDFLGVRLPSLMIHSAINIISEVILIIRPENRTTYMVGWYFNYMCNASYAILCGWATTFLAHEPEVRTMIFASGTILSYLANAFLPLWTYPAKEAPNWKVGAKFYLGSMCVCAVGFVVTAWGLRKNERKRLRAAGQNVPKPHPLAFLWT